MTKNEPRICADNANQKESVQRAGYGFLPLRYRSYVFVYPRKSAAPILKRDEV